MLLKLQFVSICNNKLKKFDYKYKDTAKAIKTTLKHLKIL